jgi:predicted site-specific integrase-resolvase
MSSDILLLEDKTELCLDEARRMLHISKRQCAELLKKGILPCTSTGKKTRQYRILRSDVEALMNTQDQKKPSEPPKDYREQLEDLWFDVPDVLTPSDVQKLTGYSQSYVSSWMVTGKLRTVTVHGSPITSREWLIEFMCRDGRKINDL